MLLPLLTSLIISTTAAPDLGKAPPVPEWPDNLPAASLTPGGVLLPNALADAVHFRLEYLDRYPELCQLALDTQADYLTTEHQGELDVMRAEHQRDLMQLTLDRPPEWGWPQRFLLIGGAMLIGAVFGAGAVLLHH